jgi:molybdate transport system substrate-binding protein
MKNPSAKNLAAACIASLMMLFGLAPGLSAAELQIAVAANFAAPIKTITQDFQRDTGHQVSLAIGATGQFYAQIRNGAPFGILLAADDETPLRLEREGFGVTGSRATYAIGRLVLWSPVPDMVDANGSILKSDRIGKIAIANPKLAPYGAAAVEVLERMGVHERLKPRIVEGANIAQAYQFVASGNASLGFVALAQVAQQGRIREGSAWIVPSQLHSPILQDAILLAAGRNNPAAHAFLSYLKSEKVRSLIRSFGYELPDAVANARPAAR